MLMDLHGEDQAQGVLFAARPALMDVIDSANARWGRGTLKLGSRGGQETMADEARTRVTRLHYTLG